MIDNTLPNQVMQEKNTASAEALKLIKRNKKLVEV